MTDAEFRHYPAPEGAIAIPEDLQELLDGSYAISVWHVDGEHEVVHNYSLGMLIDRIAALTQRAELAESRVKELSKPVTDEEWLRASAFYTDPTVDYQEAMERNELNEFLSVRVASGAPDSAPAGGKEGER